MVMNILDGLYTTVEIAMHNGLRDDEIREVKRLSSGEKIKQLKEKYPLFDKFIPFLESYNIENGNKKQKVLAMSAEIYDYYCLTGLLPNLKEYDTEINNEKLDYWEYVPPLNYSMKLTDGWENVTDILKQNPLFTEIEDGDIWKIWLAGNARMNYYTNSNTSLFKRIQFAIIEYMLKRPEFFNMQDFIENPALIKKYRKEKA